MLMTVAAERRKIYVHLRSATIRAVRPLLLMGILDCCLFDLSVPAVAVFFSLPPQRALSVPCIRESILIALSIRLPMRHSDVVIVA